MIIRLTKNFTLDEFKCKDGTEVPVVFLKNVQLLAENLQVLRDHLNVPIDLSSGYRTPEYNKKVDGEDQSLHLVAKASDITTRDFTPDEIADTIEKLIQEGKMKQGGLGRYNGFTHYDVRGTKARWDKRKKRKG